MKKVILALLMLFTHNLVFAQLDGELGVLAPNGHFVIDEEEIRIESSKQIICNDRRDSIYVAFGKSNWIKLQPKFIKNNITRAKIENRLETDRNIFVQIGAKNNGTDFLSNEIKYLAKQSGSGAADNSYVIINKKDLPLTLFIDGREITLVEFLPTDQTHCDLLRKKVNAYTELPNCKYDTLSIADLKNTAFDLLDLNPSKYWKSSAVKYFINGHEYSVTEEKFTIPDSIYSNLNAGDNIALSYKIEFNHVDGFFNHFREGKLVDIHIKESDNKSVLWLLLLIPVIILVYYYKKKKPCNNGEQDPTGSIDGSEQVQQGNEETINDVPQESEDISSKISEVKQSTDVDHVLNSLIPNLEELSTEEKIGRIKQELSSGNRAKEKILNLFKEFNISSNNYNDLVSYIKSLIESIENIKSEQNNSPEMISGQILSLMINKNSKILSSLIEKAKSECTNSTKPNYETLQKLINLLPINLKDFSKPIVVDNSSSLDFTEQQMSTATNRRKMMVWMIDQLEIKGYKGLNRNDNIDNNFTKLVELLSTKPQDENNISLEDAIDEAINNDKFTSTQKAKLLVTLIDHINSTVNDDSYLIDTSLALDDFISFISEKIQSPNNFEDAQEIIKNNNLNAINGILESDIKDFDQESLKTALRTAIVKLLNKHLKGFEAENIEEAFKIINTSLANSEVLKNTLKENEINAIDELPSKIRKKQTEEIISSVNQKVKELFPDKYFDSIQKLINALLVFSTNAKDNELLIVDELEEKISLRDSSYVSSEEKNIIKLINVYNNLITDNENKLNTDIAEKKNKILELETEITNKESEISTLSAENNSLMIESVVMVDNLRDCAEEIISSCKTILHPCSDNDESQCVDIEDRLFAELSNSINKIKNLPVDKDSTPVETRKKIQSILIEELMSDNSPINTICRYFAYSRLPFMTDTSREYGITFNRKNMYELFNTVETMYVRFGINFNIPDLFVAGYNEGNYENLTGKTYGDLDNLCQNSRNHFDNIDSKVKPSDVIVDMINVGFSVDGKVERITSVLTY